MSSLRNALPAALALLIAACAGPGASVERGHGGPALAGLDRLERQLEALEASLQALGRRARAGDPALGLAPASPAPPGGAGADAPDAGPAEVRTIARIVPLDDSAVPAPLRAAYRGRRGYLCHVLEWDGAPELDRFVRDADPLVFLDAAGGGTWIGTFESAALSSADGTTRLVFLDVGSGPFPGTLAAFRPRNGDPDHRWRVAPGALPARPPVR